MCLRVHYEYANFFIGNGESESYIKNFGPKMFAVFCEMRYDHFDQTNGTNSHTFSAFNMSIQFSYVPSWVVNCSIITRMTNRSRLQRFSDMISKSKLQTSETGSDSRISHVPKVQRVPWKKIAEAGQRKEQQSDPHSNHAGTKKPLIYGSCS